MAAKLSRMTHKTATQLHLVAESCTIFDLQTLHHVEWDEFRVGKNMEGGCRDIPWRTIQTIFWKG